MTSQILKFLGISEPRNGIIRDRVELSRLAEQIRRSEREILEANQTQQSEQTRASQQPMSAKGDRR